jgi:hypothetical protein
LHCRDEFNLAAKRLFLKGASGVKMLRQLTRKKVKKAAPVFRAKFQGSNLNIGPQRNVSIPIGIEYQFSLSLSRSFFFTLFLFLSLSTEVSSLKFCNCFAVV